VQCSTANREVAVSAVCKCASERGRKCNMFGDIWPWRDWIWGTPARNPTGATAREQSRKGEDGERFGWDQRDQMKPTISDMPRADRVGWRPRQNVLKVWKKKRKEATRFISICLRDKFEPFWILKSSNTWRRDDW